MSTDALFVAAALRNWKSNIDRATKRFEALSEEQLQEEIAPGKKQNDLYPGPSDGI